jgi:hypothetical protein
MYIQVLHCTKNEHINYTDILIQNNLIKKLVLTSCKSQQTCAKKTDAYIRIQLCFINADF